MPKQIGGMMSLQERLRRVRQLADEVDGVRGTSSRTNDASTLISSKNERSRWEKDELEMKKKT